MKLLLFQHADHFPDIHGVHVAVSIPFLFDFGIDELISGYAGGGQLPAEKNRLGLLDIGNTVLMGNVVAQLRDFVSASVGFLVSSGKNSKSS